MTLIREIAMFISDWLAGQIILAGIPIIGRERAGRWVSRWLHCCHRRFGGGCAKAGPGMVKR